jgi:bla regulator protein BlaR1
MTTELLAWLINATVAISLAGIAILFLRKPLQRWLGAEIAYGLWIALPLATLAACFSLPQSEPILSSAMPMTIASAPAVVVQVVSGMRTLDADRWLLAIWLFGACALLAVLIRQQWRFVARLRLHERGDGSWRSSVEGAAPAVLGVLRQKLVLPDCFESDYSDEEQQLVIAHERMHQQRRDPWALAVCAALRTLFWFNPIVHAAATACRRDIELACDAAVLRGHPGSRRRYADALLKTHLAGSPVPVGCLWQDIPPMKERIMLLKNARPTRRTRVAGSILVCIAALGAVGIAVAGHDAAMGAAGALAATSTASAHASAPYQVALIMSVDGKVVGNPAVITRAGETATVRADQGGIAWGLRFHVDPRQGWNAMLLTADMFTTDEQHGISYWKLIRTTGTPFVLTANDKAGHAYRVEARVAIAPPTPPSPPTGPAPPAPPAPPATADFQTPSAPPVPPTGPDVARNPPPMPPAPSAAPAPPAPAAAPQPPILPSPPSLDAEGVRPPRYPAAALKGRIGGEVKLKILIGADGIVKRAHVVSSNPAGIFAQVSLDAAKSWHFSPGRDARGHAIAAYAMVPVIFDPKDKAVQ